MTSSTTLNNIPLALSIFGKEAPQIANPDGSVMYESTRFPFRGVVLGVPNAQGNILVWEGMVLALGSPAPYLHLKLTDVDNTGKDAAVHAHAVTVGAAALWRETTWWRENVRLNPAEAAEAVVASEVGNFRS